MLALIEKHSADLDQLEINNIEELENFRIQYLSKKGIIAQLFDSFKTVPNHEKKETGARLNILKNQANEKYLLFKDRLSLTVREFTGDLSLPPDSVPLGSRHPVSLIRKEIISIFSKIGFTVAEGPEIEDDWHVFWD